MDPRCRAQLCSAESRGGSSLAADTLGASLQASAISGSDHFAEAGGNESRIRRRSFAYRQDDPNEGEPVAPQVSISRGYGGFLVMSPLVQDPAAGQQSSQLSVQRWLSGEPPLAQPPPAYSDEGLVRPRSPKDHDDPDRKNSMAPQSQDGGGGSGDTSSTPTPPPRPLAGQQGWQPDTENLPDWHGATSTTSAIPSSSTAFGGSSPSVSSTITLVGSDTRSRLSSCISEDGSVASISTVHAPRDIARSAFLGTMVPPDSDDAESSGSNSAASSSQHTRMRDVPSHDVDVGSHEESGSCDKGKKRADVEHRSSDPDQDSDFFRQRKRRRADDDERYNAARKTLRTVLYGMPRAHDQGDEVIESPDAIARIFELERALHHERMTRSSLISQLHIAQKQVEDRDREIEEHEAFWSDESGSSDEEQHSNWSNAGSVQEHDEDDSASEDGGVVDVFI